MPSYNKCFKQRLTTLTGSDTYTCHRCCDWNYLSKSSHLKHKVPDDYLTYCHNDSPDPPPSRHVYHQTTLVPVLQTFEFLIKASNFCAFNFFYKIWNVANVTTYMQSVGITPNFFKIHIIEKCRSYWNKNISHIDIDTFLDIPTMWSVGIDLCQFIDTPMHLVFQGIVKSVIEFSFDLLAKYSKKLNSRIMCLI